MSDLIASLDQLPSVKGRIFLAFSGGLDSTVLLDLSSQHAIASRLIPWHINYAVQSNADDMQAFCERTSRQHGMDLRVTRLALATGSANFEAEAREARYQCFAAELAEDDLLLTAHHADDQLETLLLNFIRGSGSDGLRGMPAVRALGKGQLCRPLLGFSRQRLETYANRRNLSWINDPSNDDTTFSRNYLRHKVLPQLRERWPHCAEVAGRVAEWQKESSQLSEELAALDFALTAKGENRLTVEDLLALSMPRQKNLLRYWLRQQDMVALPYRKLDNLLEQLSAKPDALPRIDHADYSLRRFAGDLYCLSNTERSQPETEYEFDLKEKIGVAGFMPVSTRKALFNRIDRADEGQCVTIRFHTDKTDAGQTHRLKRMFQRYRVPPWERPFTPQLYLDDELVAILIDEEADER